MEKQRRIPVLRAHDPENYETFEEWMDGRNPQEEEQISDFGLLLFVVGCLFLATAVILCGYYMIDSWSATGPGCPGDPFWLGRCSEVDGS